MVSVRLYLPLCCSRTAPDVSEEKGSYASRFYRWFLESFKSCLLLLVALPGLIDTLAQLLASRSLLWLSITWCQRYLTQSNFLSTTSLAWSLALHLLFFSVREAFTVEGNKQTHTHIHTHTHTHTHTQRQLSNNCINAIFDNGHLLELLVRLIMVILNMKNKRLIIW